MRFYGIPSEDRVLEIIEGIKDGVWVLEEDGKTQSFDAEGIKERLRELVYMVKGWKEQKVSYKTMLKLYDFIRRAIYCEVEGKGECLEGEVEMDESYFGSKRKGKRGRGAEGKIPVFGILERDGRVKVEVVKDVTSESLLKLAINKVKRGSIIYTDRYRSYDGLVSIGFRHERIDHSKRFANGKVYINGIEVL